MLVARARISDRTLEPTDNTNLYVTLYNTSCFATAKDVKARVKLQGPSLDGIQLIPDDRSFGDIPPGKKVTKEFNINTERAGVGLYAALLDLEYEAAYKDSECDRITFCVGRD